jgi:hypothetical protein
MKARCAPVDRGGLGGRAISRLNHPWHYIVRVWLIGGQLQVFFFTKGAEKPI